MREFRFVCTKEGTHWHCRVFSAEPGCQGAFIGKLVMDEQDYGALTQIGEAEERLAKFDSRDREAFALVPRMLAAGCRVATKLRLFTEHLCFDCGARIDPAVCVCGTYEGDHEKEEHPFRPMGCECGRDRS